MKRIRQILKITFIAICTVFVLYSVLFSLAATAGLTYAVLSVWKPVSQVRLLATENPKESAYMAQLRGGLGGDSLKHRFVPLDSISPFLAKAVVAAEDDAFFVHPGFDLYAIVAAYDRNRSKNRVKFGGSTITQQLAKNLFLSGDRTFQRKYKELLYTLLLEGFLTKNRILELYLNYAQWGKNIFGCEAASQHYFRKSATRLTLWEAGRLSGILAKPSAVNPYSQKSIFLGKRLQVIADNLYTKGQIGDSGYTLLTGREAPRVDSAALSAPDSLSKPQL